MSIEEIKNTLKNFSQEISAKYPFEVLSKYEEPINTEKESIFLIDIVLKKKANLDDYGFVLGLRIFREHPTTFDLTVDICGGSGQIFKEEKFTVNAEKLPFEHSVYDSIYSVLLEFKPVLFNLIDQEK